MQPNNSNTEAQMFDGPFKIPLPKKPSSFKSSGPSKSVEIVAPKAQYKKMDKNYQSLVYQNLLLKFLQSPEKLTKYDSKMLSNHPVIKMLIKSVKDNNNGSLKNANFYIPLNSIFNPELYANNSVPVIFESEHIDSDSTLMNQQLKQNEPIDEELSEESTSSSFDQEEVCQKKIGFYTVKERKERILKYKKKIMNWKKGESQTKKSLKKRKYNRLQPRFNGKFATYTPISAEISTFSWNSNESLAMTWSQQYLETNNGIQNLNDVVSEITGIY